MIASKLRFLTAPDERRAYVRKVRHALRPGGLVIVATFAEDGPTECSGLPVMRYGADALHAEFGESFRLLAHEREIHHTPGGKEQRFVSCLFRKTEPGADTAYPAVAGTAGSPDALAGHGAVDTR